MCKPLIFKAGEKVCEVCGDPLGKIRCSAYRKHFLCAKPECSFPSYRPIPMRTVKAEELVCEAPGCGKFVPAGKYTIRKQRFFCDSRCRSRYIAQFNSQHVFCACGCGTEMLRCPSASSGLRFCKGHAGPYLQRQHDIELCGSFLPLFEKYDEEFASVHYVDPKGARLEVRLFLSMLLKLNVTDINKVTPSHISQFINLRKKTQKNPRADFISVFFGWLMELELFRNPNPVRPKIHYRPAVHNGPRPYEDDVMANIWNWLGQRGNTKAKALIAIGEESGPRGKETCNLRMEDLDLRGERIFIRNPTKTGQEGWSHYSTKTNHWLKEWLKERPKCNHNFVFTNTLGDPLRVDAMRYQLKAILCKQSEYHSHEEGLDSFSYHRLRHTSATNLQRHGVDTQVNMEQHRWTDPDSVPGYAKPDPEQVAAQYHRARKRIEEQKKLRPQRTNMSLAQFSANNRK